VIKHKNILPVIVFSLIAFTLSPGCRSLAFLKGDEPEIVVKETFDKSSPIAVLNFQKESTSPTVDLGRLAAEKFTDAMFLKLGLNTIDRSRVNESMRYLGINSPESLSLDDIQKLGLRLKAGYLLLGRVKNLTGEDYLSEDCNKNLTISFRLVSVLNGNVVALGSYSSKYEGDAAVKIDEMVGDIMEKMKSGSEEEKADSTNTGSN
jgi:hypothetical protein